MVHEVKKKEFFCGALRFLNNLKIKNYYNLQDLNIYSCDNKEGTLRQMKVERRN